MKARRTWLLALAASALLAGCGFQLRASQSYAFESIALTPPRSPVALELTRYLSGRLRIASAPDVTPPPDVVLDILQETRDRIVVGVNTSGQVREMQLRLNVKFRLRTPRGMELIAPTDIVQQRDISYSETAALSKEAEEAMLYRDMQADTVQQLLRRLAAVKDVKP